MPKFLIEVPHEADMVSCLRAIQVFLTTGSHFLTHADWGCQDGVHSAWITVEMDTRAEALLVVPPMYRHAARVVGLNQFTMHDIEPLLRQHQLAGGAAGPSGG